MIMTKLSNLPNIGKVLEKTLISAGVNSPEALKTVGAKEAFLKIRLQVDDTACLHVLYALEGAVQGIRYTQLSEKDLEELKVFYSSL